VQRITVYVADDHPLFLDAIGRAVSSRPEFKLVGSAGDGREALTAIRRLHPAISLLDQQLPSLSGTEILRALTRDGVPTRVVILSGSQSTSLAYDAVQLGAAGVLTKAATLTDVCDTIATVARGGTVLAPEVQSDLVSELRMRSEPGRTVLSEREAEVLTLIADGLSVPEIAERLMISTATVKTHVKNLFEKLGVHERAAAVAEAMRRGLVE
jgi:two-component system nitrate/nitrite response regulator NarL